VAIWGKTGTGKTLTLTYFLTLLAEMAHAKQVLMRSIHLDLSNPRPCFRALNDLACLLDASKRYEKGISLEEMMFCIERKLADYDAYRAFCTRADVRPLTGRVFSDMLAELDLYSLLQCRIISRRRYGRTREITLDLPAELIGEICSSVLANFHLV